MCVCVCRLAAVLFCQVGNLKRIKNNLERSIKLFRQKTEKAEKARASEGGQLAYLAEGTTSR